MTIQLLRWINFTAHSITFVKGVSGVPWPGCDSQPGGIIQAPASYERACREAGYTLVTAEMQTSLDEEAQLKAMIAEDEAKAAVKANVVPEKIEAPAAIIAPPREAPPVEPVKGIKRRGRSD